MFTIRKDPAGNFFHDFGNGGSSVHLSDFEVLIDDIKNTFIIEPKNGSNIPSQSVPLSEVQVIDEITSPSPITYTGASGLITLLKSLYYTPYLINVNITTPITIWTKGQRTFIIRDQTWIDNNFDVTTGMGINEMIGWEKDDEMEGRVPVGQSSNIPFQTINAKAGSKNAVLIAHDGWSTENTNGLPIVNPLGKGPIASGVLRTNVSFATDHIDLTQKVGQNENGVFSDTENGQGKNLQPYTVVLFIRRTVDLILVGANYVLPFNTNQINAILGANNPSASNVFATMADVGGGSTTDPLWGTFKRIRKGFGNVNLAVDEAGDVYEGGKDATTYSYIAVLKTTGASLTNEANFDHYLEIPIP